MSYPFKVEDVAKATQSPLANVQKNWAFIEAAAKESGLTDIKSMVALVATIGAECHFACIEERGPIEYFKKYDNVKVLGNNLLGDGYKYRGRGFIQLTGKYNYAKYGNLIGLPLETNPDLALDPKVAAKIMVAYFKDHGCDVWANRGHWLRVRELVNGKRKNAKPNGWDHFSEYVWSLLDVAHS